MKVFAYPVAGKRKSLEICSAFVAGCGGEIVTDGVLRDGAAFFYGVDASNHAIWRAVRADHDRDFFYSDNSYFDSSRQAYFRVSRNMLQHSGRGVSDGKRLAALGITLKPWRVSGEHIVVCHQSDHFMRVVVGHAGDWQREIAAALAAVTSRAILVRAWSPDKGMLANTLAADLCGAHALVTWSSAAAITAVLSGVPVVTLGQCAAEPMAGVLGEIERLPTSERENWAGVLADNQWTLDEFRSGFAWERLNEKTGVV